MLKSKQFSQLIWFIGLWIISVIALGIVAYGIKLVIQ